MKSLLSKNSIKTFLLVGAFLSLALPSQSAQAKEFTIGGIAQSMCEEIKENTKKEDTSLCTNAMNACQAYLQKLLYIHLLHGDILGDVEVKPGQDGSGVTNNEEDVVWQASDADYESYVNDKFIEGHEYIKYIKGFVHVSQGSNFHPRSFENDYNTFKSLIEAGCGKLGFGPGKLNPIPSGEGGENTPPDNEGEGSPVDPGGNNESAGNSNTEGSSIETLEEMGTDQGSASGCALNTHVASSNSATPFFILLGILGWTALRFQRKKISS